jgi:hypothetical protein
MRAAAAFCLVGAVAGTGLYFGNLACVRTGDEAARRAATAGGRVGPAQNNSDPVVDGCQADQRQLDSTPVYREDGAKLGLIALMYSPSCEAAWGYLEAPNSSEWTIHIVTQRIPGPGITNWQFSGNAPFGSWGNVLSTRAGCVYTEAWVVDKSGQGPVSRTACMKPTP